MASNMEIYIPDQWINDNKSYKYLQLQNGLRALIVSDPSLRRTNQAALALTVDCGSFQDPRNYHGLAHVLEHLLRKDDIFKPYVKRCGGVCDIRTDCEETMFHFAVPEPHLTSCLLHLTALLIKQDSPDRTMLPPMESVQLKAEDYKLRRDRRLASLASDSYPHGLYDWLNLSELQAEDPEDAFASMIQQLRRDNYVANRMHVCLQASLTLVELEEIVYRHFAVIPSNDSESTAPSFDYRNAFRAEFHEKVFYENSLDGRYWLDLTWLLPSVRQYYRSKSDRFLAYLLGQEGAGSLCVYLRRRRWSIRLLAGIDDDGFHQNSIYSLFRISIHLTVEGFEHIGEILAAIFAYIKLIAAADSSLLQRLYDKQQTIEEAKFHFPLAQRTAVQNVQYLVLNSKYYPAKDVLIGSHYYFEYSQQHMSEMIGFVNKMDFNLVITDADAEYVHSSPMPHKWQKLWHESQPIGELCLPEPNRFVSEDFTLFWMEQGRPVLPPAPERLLHTRICELWHRLDDTFVEPKATMSFYFISPLQRQSARKDAMCNLYVNLVEVQLLEQLYPAAAAGIRYDFTAGDKGLVLKLHGYNEKLHLVVEAIVQAMVTIADTLDESTLITHRDNLRKFYFDDLLKSPLLCGDIRQCVIEESRWLSIDKYKSISGITLDGFKEFARKFREELYIKALIEGNYTAEEASNVLNAMISRLQCRPIREPRCMENRVKKLPLGSHCIRCNGFNERDTHTVISNYYQIGPHTMRTHCLLDLMLRFVQHAMSFYLCAHERVCHDVCAQVCLDYGIIGYSITAATRKTNNEPNYMEHAIEKFRSLMINILKKVNSSVFANTKRTLITERLAPAESLTQASDRHWEEIISGEYLFDRNQQMADIMGELVRTDMYSLVMQTNAVNFRKLSVQVIGNSSHDMDSDTLLNKSFFSTSPEEGSSTDDAEMDDSDSDMDVDVDVDEAGYDESAMSIDGNQSLYEDLGNQLSLVFLPRVDNNMQTIVDIDEFKTSLETHPGPGKLMLDGVENPRVAHLEQALARNTGRAFQPN